MSTRIVDEFVAVRFPEAALSPHVAERECHGDMFMFFELGGDNNVTTRHPRTGAEVRARSWSLLAVGAQYQAMQTVVERSAACEGGCLRFSRASSTLPETYISKARKAMDSALSVSACLEANFFCSVELQVPEVHKQPDWQAYHAKRLTALRDCMPPSNEDNGTYSWRLSPFHDMAHAAVMFTYWHMDARPSWLKTSITGRTFGRQGIMEQAQFLAGFRRVSANAA